MKIDYKIISEDMAHKLQEKVLHFIEAGWTPLGGIAVNGGGQFSGKEMFHQVIIKNA